MAVQWTKIREDSTSIPSDSGARTYTFGENIPAGAIEAVVFRFTTVNTTAAINSDFGMAINNLRLTLNGSVIHDFRAGANDCSLSTPSMYGYLLNSLGTGALLERPSDLTKEAYAVVPVGVQAPAGVSRMEFVLGYAATNAGVASGTLQVWLKYNDNCATRTMVVPSTSFTHASSIEQVVVRIPADLPSGSVIAGCYVQNDSFADQYGSQGVRIMSQSAYGLDADFLRAFNGDLNNGIVAAVDGTSTANLQYFQSVEGALFIPTYDLTPNGDLILQVDSSAATTRTYTPVIVAPFNGKEGGEMRQTAKVAANTSKSILSKTLE